MNRSFMKILNIFLSIMFLSFAGLQFNDPDPILWIMIYGAMTAVCLMAAYKIHIKPLMLLMALFYTGYALILWSGVLAWYRSPDRSLLFDDFAKMQFAYIEETREFIGLLICVAVLGLYWLRSTRAIVR